MIVQSGKKNYECDSDKPRIYGERIDTQATLKVNWVRGGFVEERAPTINRVRALLSEFGIVLPLRHGHNQWR